RAARRAPPRAPRGSPRRAPPSRPPPPRTAPATRCGATRFRRRACLSLGPWAAGPSRLIWYRGFAKRSPLCWPRSVGPPACGRGGIGRRAALRSLWGKLRGSSSLLDRTKFLLITSDRASRKGRRMRNLLLGMLLLAGLAATSAMAQSLAGRYEVHGTNPNGSSYSGTAEII